MPELPEVEYTRQNLERWMRGARIRSVATSDARIVRPKTPTAFVRAVSGRHVEQIKRKGKWLRIALDDGTKIFAHLGMTGWFERYARGEEPKRFERALFELDKNGARARVAYVDTRRWGRLVHTTHELATWTDLGPDPLGEGIDGASRRR